MLPVAITIAGSDPSGGAGIQADLKTFHQFGVYGMSVISLLTVQNTLGVKEVLLIGPDKVSDQLNALLEDFSPNAIKIGALGTAAATRLIAAQIKGLKCPKVLDPIIVSTSGMPLLSNDARQVLVDELLPYCDLITPNLDEASALTGSKVEDRDSMKDAARSLSDKGAKAVLVKGGHLSGEAVDVLYSNGTFSELKSSRIETPHTHGTGCTLSAAITAELAKGMELEAAVSNAKEFVTQAIETAPKLGQGNGPINHFVKEVTKEGV